jgi:hypothetical protein
MNPARSAYLPICLCLTAFILIPQILPAQATTTPEAPAQLTPSELYRDTKALRIVTELDLTRAQIEKIVPVVQTVADQLVADQQADAHAYELVAEEAETAIAALTRGQEPPPREMSLLDRAAGERNKREDFRAGLTADAAARIQRMLTAEQAFRIETAAEQAEREAMEMRLEGAASPLDYVIVKLKEQMELMPDEYLRTRERRALDMARTMFGEDSPRARTLAAQLLTIMDQVASLTPEQYGKRRAKLREDIAEALGLEEAPPRRILYEEFIAWIVSERTPVVLRELLNVRPTEAEEEGVTP